MDGSSLAAQHTQAYLAEVEETSPPFIATAEAGKAIRGCTLLLGRLRSEAEAEAALMTLHRHFPDEAMQHLGNRSVAIARHFVHAGARMLRRPAADPQGNASALVEALATWGAQAAEHGGSPASQRVRAQYVRGAVEVLFGEYVEDVLGQVVGFEHTDAMATQCLTQWELWEGVETAWGST